MFSIKDNIDEFERALSDFAQAQLPFAVALTLNDTAMDVKKAEERALERDLDAPTPFTKRGIFVRRASKRRLTATVGVKDRQAAYLIFQAQGGVRMPRGRALTIPVGQRKNKYGNMPRSAVQRLLSRQDTFVAGRSRKGTKHLRSGIYKKTGRKGKKIKLMVAFEDRAQYRKRLDYNRVARVTAQAVAADHFARRFKEAIATAR